MNKYFKNKVDLIKKGLLLVGLGLLMVGLIMSLFFNVILSPAWENHLVISTDEEFTVWGRDIEIDCIIMTPKAQYDIFNERPAIVLVHGFISSNVYWRATALELCKRGFLCMLITARGHSASGGQFGPTWENETLSAVKYLRDHNETLRVDTDRIGLVGHSMGAFSVTKAAIMDSNSSKDWINATVAVGGPYYNISKYFGNGFEFMLSNPFFYPFPFFSSEVAIKNVVFEGKTSNSTPINYMNIIGQFDEAFPLASAYELVYGMADTNYWSGYGVNNAGEIISGHQYGAFDNGTARKLVVEPLVDHLIEGFVSTTSLEIINWFEDSMKLTTRPGYTRVSEVELVTVELMSIAPVIAIIGGIILIIPATIYIGNWLRKDHEIEPEQAQKIEKQDLWKLFLIYGGTVVGLSLLPVPIILGANLLNVISTDFLASSLLSAPYFIQGLLLIPVIIMLIFIEKKKYGEKLSDFGLSKDINTNLRGVAYGSLLFLVMFVTFNLALSPSIQNVFPWRFLSFLELFMYLFIGMLMIEIIFRGFIQSKLSRYRNKRFLGLPAGKEILITSLVTGTILGFSLAIWMVEIFMFGSGTNTVNLNSIMATMGLPLTQEVLMILIFPLMICVGILLQILQGWLYRKSGNNVIACAVFGALVFAWIFSALLPSTVLFAPRYILLT